MIIYKATNRINGKIYIGQTRHTLEERKRRHERDSGYSYRSHSYFHDALQKYGFESFDWEVIDKANTLEELDELEIKYINMYNSMNREVGYNTKSGGLCGGNYNEEWKASMGEATKKKWKNPETRKKMMVGCYKTGQIMKDKYKDYWVERVCPVCGKTFRVKPHEKKISCSVECSNILNKDKFRNNIDIANKLNAEEWEKSRRLKCKKLVEWVKNNEETILNAKFNHLTFIKEIAKFINVKDDRTVAKVIGLNYRREFVAKLQEMLNSNGDETCACGGKVVSSGKYKMCMECGDSWLCEQKSAC